MGGRDKGGGRVEEGREEGRGKVQGGGGGGKMKMGRRSLLERVCEGG